MSCSSCSVYIHIYFKKINPIQSCKITVRISYHDLRSKRIPDLDLTFINDCPDDEFVCDCISQITQLINKEIANGEPQAILPAQ